MKKILQFLALPTINIALVPLLINLIMNWNINIGISVMYIVALLLYVFVSGVIFSKIKDKKIKAESVLVTVVLYFIIGIVIAIWSNNSDNGYWAGIMTIPLSMAIQSFAFSKINAFSYIVLVLSAPLPVLLSVGVSKVFSTERKWLKIVGAVLIVAIVGSGITYTGKAIYDTYHNDYTYVGDDGQFYNAFYDVNGIKYEDVLDVPYYDTKGNKYYQTYDESKDTEENFLYCGELTDENGKTYDFSIVYINADGYIFIDENDEIILRDDLPDDVDTDWQYCDSDGNIYAQFLSISYLSDGTPFTGMGPEYRTK